MVSNTLDMNLRELVVTLKRLRRKYRDDPEYQELRRDLPEEWPV